MKKRRTRSDKARATGFRINFSGIEKNQTKKLEEIKKASSYLRSDLTKVGLLTMLALALELLLYWKAKP